MDVWPVWNYWLFDADGEYNERYDDTLSAHPDADFLYGTEAEPEWAHKFFWTVDEAAALSFGRSPNKVPYDKYIEEMDGSSEFATLFCDVREQIEIAQREKGLLSPMPAQAYVEVRG